MHFDMPSMQVCYGCLDLDEPWLKPREPQTNHLPIKAKLSLSSGPKGDLVPETDRSVRLKSRFRTEPWQH
jgi:hypothetical protein